MFDDPESELIDFEEKSRWSMIPDPEGDELRRIANVKGISAVSHWHKFQFIQFFY